MLNNFSSLEKNLQGFSPGLWAKFAGPPSISLLSDVATNSLLKSSSWREPIFCLTTKKSEVGESCSVIPILWDLAFIDARDEFLSIDSVLAFFTEKLGNFNHFLFECNVGVGQNFLCQLCCHVLSSWIDDEVLLLGDATSSRSSSNRIIRVVFSPLENYL